MRYAPFANDATDAITLCRDGRSHIKNVADFLSPRAYISHMSWRSAYWIAERAHFMAETMILIPGRTTKQGVGLLESKFKKQYRVATTTVEVNVEDMARLGLKEGGKVKMRSADGVITVKCTGRKTEDLPPGILFIAYGPPTSKLMGKDTAASGMPLSKHLEVELERVN